MQFPDCSYETKIDPNSFDSRALRDVFGRFATGVAIVTTVTDDGVRLGMTISSFTSLSLSPPLIMFNIGLNAPSIDVWKSARGFVVNILSEQQKELSACFGRAGDKWNGVDFRIVEYGASFPGALAILECEAYRNFEGGDHLIFLGKLQKASVRNELHAAPLIHFGGSYRRVASFESVSHGEAS